MIRPSTYYFAFGSNMHTARMVERIASARVVESALLVDHILTFNKMGRDGSGKCSVVFHSGQYVAGVIYRIEAQEIAVLDKIEGSGYRRKQVVVHGLRSGSRFRASCYQAISAFIDAHCTAFDWYHELVVSGAEAHELPATYIERLRSVPTRIDPNRLRRRQADRQLAGRGP